MRFCFYVSAAAAAAVFHFHLICVAVAVAFVGSSSHPRIVSRKTNGFTSSTAPNKCATISYSSISHIVHSSFAVYTLFCVVLLRFASFLASSLENYNTLTICITSLAAASISSVHLCFPLASGCIMNCGIAQRSGISIYISVCLWSYKSHTMPCSIYAQYSDWMRGSRK